MYYKFVNRPAVTIDIIDAVNHYKQINPKLAKQFLFEFVRQKLTSLNCLLAFK